VDEAKMIFIRFSYFLQSMSRQFIRVLTLDFVLLVLVSTSFSMSTLRESTKAGRPNFLIIISDDQRYDTMDFMPRTKARIFDQGINFSNAYVTTPLCCPSRASILTGMYAHNHGVRLNQDTLRMKTFVEALHENGYYTGLVGKYLNSWDGSPRPEFDFWVSHAGGDSRYYGPSLNVNGTWSVHPGYITHIFRDYALQFLRFASQQDKPVVLIFSPNAPHAPANPAPGDDKLYPNLSEHRPPNFNEADMSDKPRSLWFVPLLAPEQIAANDSFRRLQLQSLNALDIAVESLLAALARQNILDNTCVIYLSDNGYFWGEHRFQGKAFVYEEAIRVPFALRYPPLVRAPRVETRMVANIDIAPTIYELAGVPMPPEVDGRSLVPLAQLKNEWRDDLLIEGWPGTGRAPYAAVHTANLVYVETEGDLPEFYDLKSDPYQLDNQVNDPANAAVVANLQQRLQRLKEQTNSVQDFNTLEPHDFSLLQNYPNPFNPSTTIRFVLSRRSHVKLEILDVLGKEVMTLIDDELNPGEHSVIFEAQDLPSGIYFYRLLTPMSSQTKLMLTIK
jgi:arylsulfatase A-like enzyme